MKKEEKSSDSQDDWVGTFLKLGKSFRTKSYGKPKPPKKRIRPIDKQKKMKHSQKQAFRR